MPPLKRVRTEAKHGTLPEYTRYGCRCERCRSAMRDYMRQYRKGKRGTYSAWYGNQAGR